MKEYYDEYKQRVDPLIDEEVDKLGRLQARHHQFLHQSYSQQHQRRERELRRVDKIFEDFVAWVTDTLQIEESSYVRVIAVMTGVNR
jgi:hypothetical protein